MALLATVWLFAGVAGDAAQDSGRHRRSGIEPLTLDTHAEAIACGKEGADCAIEPYRLCPDTLVRYRARLATPFSRVASGVAESISNGGRVRPMTPGAANGWGVGIYVLPADAGHAEAIQRVFLKQGGDVIQPVTSTVAPWILTRADGTKLQSSRGFFAFPMDAFSPSAPTTVVLVGRLGEATCTLDAERLADLR